MNDENVNLNSEKNKNPNKIYIKAKEHLYTFEKGSYDEERLSPYINKKDFDDIIENCGKVMGQSWAKKRTNDQIKIPSIVIVLSIISVILTIAYMVTLYLSTTQEDGTALFVISIICISVATVIVFGMSIYNFCRKISKFKSLDLIIKEDLEKELSGVNFKYKKLHFEYDPEKKQLVITINDSRYKGEEEVEMKNIN